MKANALQLLEAKMDLLTMSQRKVADYILKNPTEVAFLTIDQLSRLVKTSTTTIVRLTVTLGYSGYAMFQKDLQELLRNRVTPPQRLATNIKRIGQNKLLVDCAKTQIDNITSTVSFLSDEIVDKTINLILSAKKIYVIGIRGSMSTANYLNEGLTRIIGNCELLVPDSVHLHDILLSLTADHVLIAVSLPRYAKRTVEIVQASKDRGARIVSITDGYSSPLALLSDILLPCAFSSLAFHNSEIGAMFIADFLITAIAAKDPDAAKQRLQEFEKLYAQLDSAILK